MENVLEIGFTTHTQPYCLRDLSGVEDVLRLNLTIPLKMLGRNLKSLPAAYYPQIPEYTRQLQCRVLLHIIHRRKINLISLRRRQQNLRTPIYLPVLLHKRSNRSRVRAHHQHRVLFLHRVELRLFTVEVRDDENAVLLFQVEKRWMAQSPEVLELGGQLVQRLLLLGDLVGE